MRLIGRRRNADGVRLAGRRAAERAGGVKDTALNRGLPDSSAAANQPGLLAWRRAAGLTQKELARKARVSRSTVSHVENGRYEPSCGFAGKVCRALSEALATPLYTWDVFPACFARPAALPAAQQQSPTEEVAGDDLRK